jgi:hypothetical protein
MATEWMKHVKKTMKEHKGVSLSDVLKMAKKTYKKQKGGDGEAPAEVSPFSESSDLSFSGSNNASPSAPVRDAAPVGGRRRKTSKKTKKSKKTSKKTRKH